MGRRRSGTFLLGLCGDIASTVELVSARYVYALSDMYKNARVYRM
jgi:hypothetical protein